jgi:YaiO family outer membrane protein
MRNFVFFSFVLLCAHAPIQAEELLPLSLKMSQQVAVEVGTSEVAVVAEPEQAEVPELPVEEPVAPEELAAAAAPLAVFQMSGYLELGVMQHQLTQNYPNWNGQFVRGFLRTAVDTAWQLEILGSSQFGDSGTLLVLGNTYDINENWYTTNSIASSRGGFFLSQLKLDSAINRIWLDGRNLVTSVGLGVVQAKDEHSDLSVMLSGAYHFSEPWVLEGGIRFNQSNPGGVASTGKYAALTYGRDQASIVSLRYGFGTEAYQTLGTNVQISNFASDVYTLTWRKWLRPKQGVQLRLEAYKNPNYSRNGVEVSVFQEF